MSTVELFDCLNTDSGAAGQQLTLNPDGQKEVKKHEEFQSTQNSIWRTPTVFHKE